MPFQKEILHRFNSLLFSEIARYCSCVGIEPCASIRSSALLKNALLSFLHERVVADMLNLTHVPNH
jgi:hypothetical protein